MTGRNDAVPGGRVALTTAAAMVAFAANSVLAREGLQDPSNDPGTFAAVRLISGAAFLLLLVTARRGRRSAHGVVRASAWVSAIALSAYAIGFSYAYLSLGAGTGALILFGVVQATILSVALIRGERPGASTWTGLVVAVIGLLYLVGPGVTSPDPLGSALMAGAGIAWAIYTLRGRRTTDPVVTTTANFLYTVPIAAGLLVLVALTGSPDITLTGMGLAVLSGAIASGLGYVLWYAALRSLTRTTAGIVQLTPAPLAAIGGLMIIGEPITARLVIASVLILGGVAMAVLVPGRRRGDR